MAESPTPALPGGVEWLPALGGAHLLRAELGRGDPPALILHTASGTEHRIEPGPEARFSRSTDYLVPPGFHWTTASLHWPDGTRTHLPPPPGERGELIALPTRRPDPAPMAGLGPWAAAPQTPNRPPTTRLRPAGLAASAAPTGRTPTTAAPTPISPAAAPGPEGLASAAGRPTPSAPADGLAPAAAAPTPSAPASGPTTPAPDGLAPAAAAPTPSDPASGATTPAPDGLAPASGGLAGAPAPSSRASGAAAPAPDGLAPASGGLAAALAPSRPASGAAAAGPAGLASAAAAPAPEGLAPVSGGLAAASATSGRASGAVAPQGPASAADAPAPDGLAPASGGRAAAPARDRSGTRAPSGPAPAAAAPAPDGLAPASGGLAAASAPSGRASGDAAPGPAGLASAAAAPAPERLAPAAAAPAPDGLASGGRAAAPAPDRPGTRAPSGPASAPAAATSDGLASVAPAPGDVASRARALAPLHWTAPPAEPGPPRLVSDALAAADGWRATRVGLQKELATVAEAVVRARDSERVAGDAVLAVLAGVQADLQAVRAARAADAALLAALNGQLEAERIAHAATRETAAGADAAEAIRERLERACHDAAVARAEVSALRAELEAERAARALAEQALAGAAPPSRSSLEQHASEQARAAAAAPRRPSEELIAALDAAAVSLRAAVPEEKQAPQVDTGAALKALGYTEPAPSAQTTISPSPWRLSAQPSLPPPLAPVPAPRPGLLRALVSLARVDSVAAGSLLAGLLPAQGAILEADISYDLTVRGFGTFAITVRDGSADVQRIARRRPRREAAFHLAGDPLALAELLAGEQRRIRRFGRAAVKVNGRRKRVRALAPLPAAGLTLADLVKAGARLEPSLVYRALPFAVAPEWTRGHVFTVAQEIVEFGPRAWYITARDGVPLDVVEHVSGAAADATVTMTRAAFDRLLRGEPAAEGDLPIVRGNRAAVAALKRWTELAAGAG